MRRKLYHDESLSKSANEETSQCKQNKNDNAMQQDTTNRLKNPKANSEAMISKDSSIRTNQSEFSTVQQTGNTNSIRYGRVNR